MRILHRNTVIIFVLLLVPVFSAAQAVKKTPAATPKPTPDPATTVPSKKNDRPDGQTGPARAESVKPNARATEGSAKKVEKKDPPVYFYEFSRPGFVYPRILIEHDEAGKGKISFTKTGSEEFITDPIELSSVTLEKIRAALSSLNFLNSQEDYQYPKDFSNLGNVTLTVRKDGRERTAKYNWTVNKDAKMLMDEYRRIGNQYIWKFEITLARENQPLETPGLMDMLDSYFRGSEISDPGQLVPFLTTLSNDERLPLIARNHASKLIKQVEKPKK